MVGARVWIRPSWFNQARTQIHLKGSFFIAKDIVHRHVHLKTVHFHVNLKKVQSLSQKRVYNTIYATDYEAC